VLEPARSSTRAPSGDKARDVNGLLKRRICTSAHNGALVTAFNCDEITQEGLGSADVRQRQCAGGKSSSRQ
jgi:hypothetical protein